MKIAIVGLGLIGGSLGMALKRKQSERPLELIGIDIDQNIVEQAVGLKAIDHGTTDLSQGVADADIIFVAAYLSKTAELIRQILPYVKPGAIITDTGSTKTEIALQIEELLQDYPFVKYIGGHPMAGSEKSGIIAADPYLLENAVYVLLAQEKKNQEALETVASLVRLTGARVLTLSAMEHDRMVASISHLPHLLSGILVNTVGSVEKDFPDVFKLAAGGFRDVTRIADSQPELWRDIFYSNKESLQYVLGKYKEQLEKMEMLLETDTKEELLTELEQARFLRRQVPKKVKGLLPALSEIVVTIPDKPGEIGKVANILGAKDINIIDIEILRVREGDGGTLRLGFTREEDRERAIEVLDFFEYVSKKI